MNRFKNPPHIKQHDGIFVVRDDLIRGGSKARFLIKLFKHASEVVYATPAEGGAQTALAWAAKVTGRRATLFVAARKTLHPRTAMAAGLGAKIVQVRPGYLNVVQKRARDYCAATGSILAPFGMNTTQAVNVLSHAAQSINIRPDEVWCAAGSGTLARALAKAWPNARRHVVQIGRGLKPDDVAGAIIHRHSLPFARAAKSIPPFPSDSHYDAKAWEICRQYKGQGCILFWNVTGPPIVAD